MDGWGRGRSGLGGTEAGPWCGPITLDSGEIGAASCGLDRQGRGLAIWERNGELWTRRLLAGGQPGGQTRFLGPGRAPHLALNLEGRGLLVWIDDQPDGGTLVGQSFALGRRPGEPVRVFTGAGRIQGVQLAVDRRGGALLVWQHLQAGRGQLLASRFDARSRRWEAPLQLDVQPDSGPAPRLAMNRRGQAVVIWAADTSWGQALVAAYHLPSQRLWSDRPVLVHPASCRDYQAGLDQLGNLLCLWVDSSHGQRPRLEARLQSAQDGLWRAPELLARARAFRQVRLSMAGSGEAMAAWLQWEDSGRGYLHGKGFAGGSWDPQVTRLDPGLGPIGGFALAVVAAGTASLLCLARPRGGALPVLRDRCQEWLPPWPVGEPGGVAQAAPCLSLGGRAGFALWRQATAAGTQLRSAWRS